MRISRRTFIGGSAAAPTSVIHAARLDLVLMSSALMRALLAADWDQAALLLGAPLPAEWRGEDWQWLGQRPGKAEADPSVVPWLPRVLLLRAADDHGGPEPAVVGNAGFHGPPDGEGRVEIGYAVAAEHRRRGYAEEAVRALMAWATAEHGITRFRASISPRNTPSLSLIRKLGFAQPGIGPDRRGEDLIFHHDVPGD
jgi:ribosomal-protein-alanine N-acetyltransferase